MLHCPRCSSPNVVSNKFDEGHLARIVDAAQIVQQLGNRRLSILTGLGALAAKGISALRKDYRCTDCDHRFDGADVGVTTVA